MSIMNFAKPGTVFSLAAAGLIMCSTAATAQECPHSQAQAADETTQLVAFQSGTKEKADIVDTAVSAGKFTTLVAAVKAAGLVETLKGEGPFTVLAPSDDAFSKIPASAIQDLLKPENKDKLTAILTNHVIQGSAMAADVQGMESVTVLGGGELPVVVKDGSVMIGEAKVVKADIECANGVIHVIDTVLMPTEKAAGSEEAAMGSGTKAAEPQDIVDTAVGAGKFNTLVAAVQAAELVETLKGEGPFTVFAPSDDAFAKVPEATLATLLKPENKEMLQGILTYHVVPGKVMAADVVGLETATTANGQDLEIVTEEGVVTINGSKVIATDIECENGVIHVIDTVLMPKTE